MSKFAANDDVAIKEMKQVDEVSDSTGQFHKEVSTLDKFLYDFIVHFYGACPIKNNVMMMTEWLRTGR